MNAQSKPWNWKRFLAWQLTWLVPLSFAVSFFIERSLNLVYRQSFSEQGGPDPVFDTMILGLPHYAICFFSFIAFVVGSILSCIRSTRFAGVFFLFCGLGYLGGCGLQDHFAGDPRREAFIQFGQRMTPLIDAIEKYHGDTGKYPESLDVLVPTYLEKLPETKMGNFKEYRYYVGKTQCDKGNPWCIKMWAGSGLSFAQLCYFPLQNYTNPPCEQIGKWVYLPD